jgi:hypothetical protein
MEHQTVGASWPKAAIQLEFTLYHDLQELSKYELCQNNALSTPAPRLLAL